MEAHTDDNISFTIAILMVWSVHEYFQILTHLFASSNSQLRFSFSVDERASRLKIWCKKIYLIVRIQ